MSTKRRSVWNIMKRRVLSLLLVLSMVLTLLPVQAFAVDAADPLRVVKEGDWYRT